MRSLADHQLPTCAARATLAAALSLLSYVSRAGDVCVYTDAAHPVAITTHDVRLVRLDEPQNIQSQLSRELPRDAGLAAQIVRQRLNAQGDSLSHRLSTAYEGVVEAWSRGVLKVPAIVVDSRFVVYGDRDVAHALSLIEQYRGVTR